MVYSLNTTRLLLAHDSQDEAEQLINALRKADRIGRARLVLNEKQLLEALGSGNWDLVLCRPKFGQCPYTQALSQLKRLGKSPRFLLLSDDFSEQALLKSLAAGADGIAPKDNDKLLALLVDQQLTTIQLRRELQERKISLHEAERRLDALMNQSRDAIAYVVDGMHISANESYAALFGFQSSDDLTGVPLMDLIAPADQKQLKKSLKKHLKNPAEDQQLLCHGQQLGGDQFDASLVLSASSFDGEECTQIVIHQSAGVDEAALRQLSQTDPTTNLPNRDWLLEQLDQTLTQSLTQGVDSAVFYLRVDNFDQHQTHLGIANADVLLKKLAEGLASLTKDAPLARISNDAFSLIKAIPDPDEAAQYGETLRHFVEQLMPEVKAQTVQISATIGIAFVRENSQDSQAVLTKALECCNRANASSNGKGNKVLVHNPVDDYEAGSAQAITLAVKQAIKKKSFQLQYQYIMSVADSDTHFFEVFVKLPQPDGSILTPSQFMPFVSEEGLASHIDRLVAYSAMTQLAESKSNARLLINLNGASLQDKGLAAWLIKAIRATKVSPSQLVFQLNEGDASAYLKQAGIFANTLSEAGCHFSISRFGGILSPFKLLEHIPAQILKLEGSYTREMDNKDQHQKMTDLVSKAHEQHKAVLVGFVESPQQMLPLWQMSGVCYLQGYYLGQPSESLATALELANTND